MPEGVKAVAPIDMLRKCRAHFDSEAIRARRNAAAEQNPAIRDPFILRAQNMQKFVDGIDATLRDWA